VVRSELVLIVVRAAFVRVEPPIDERVLDMHSFAQHWQVDCIHIVAMDPDLAHYYVGGSLALYLDRRCPDMFREVAQPRGGGAIGLEDSWVAEQHRDNDGQDDGEQPMARSRSAVSLEGASDGVGGG
jgi:hypothetical protein